MKYDDENLVAYLDGELDEATSSAVAEEAETNPDVRQRLKQLSSSWAMLDELPAERLNSQVAQSTMEMVALAIEDDNQTWFDYAKRYRLAIAAAAIVLSLASGVVAGRVRSQAAENRILGQLHFVIRSERLISIPSTDFLDMLTGIKQLVSPETTPASQSENVAEHGRIFSMSIDERRDWIDTLSDTERQSIARKIDTFNQQRKEVIDKAHLIGRYIAEHPERRDDYIPAINAYYKLTQENSNFADSIIEALAEGNVELQRQLVLDELAYQHKVTPEDRKGLITWASNIFADTPMYYSSNDFEQYVLLQLSYDASESELSQTDIDAAMDTISERAASLLGSLLPSVQRDVLLTWFTIAVAPDDAAFAADFLKERFDALPSKKQSELLLLPADAVREILSRPKPLLQ